MMQSFLLALQFLTITPVRLKYFHERNMGRAMIYFPVIGLLLGLTLAVGAKLMVWLGLESLSIAIILAVFLAILTGGMHLDGLSDTADSFLSGRPKEEMLRIMRDPHAGVMGVLGIIFILLLKIAFLFSLDSRVLVPALILMCVMGRWSMVGLMYLFPYARQEGKAKIFMRYINQKTVLFCGAVALAMVILFWHFRSIPVFLLVSAGAYLFGRFVKHKLGGITGDTLGAACEIAEAFTLFCVLIIWRLSHG